MLRSRRHRPGTPVGAPLLRCRDVAVTCPERPGTRPAGAEPAPRLLTGPEDAPQSRTSQVAVGVHLVAGRAAEIHSVVDEALRRAPAVLELRLHEVERFDAAGVGLLLRLQAQARRQGTDLVCSEPPRRLVAVLHRTGAAHLLTVVS